MIKLLTIVGARPQIIKASAMNRAIRTTFPDSMTEVILHTGQHYDKEMSEVFFTELDIPAPDYQLHVGSLSHGKQTARMIEGIEEVILTEKPDVVLVYGDTNSTLAGALAASKLHVPLAHIEAGLRSFNKSMPEEVNRVLADHVSSFLFCPTHTAIENLKKEGFDTEASPPFNLDHPGIFHCGDVMYDNSLHFADVSATRSTILQDCHLTPDRFVLATVHRDNNTDEPSRLNAIMEALLTVACEEGTVVVLPAHPRTRKAMERNLAPALESAIRETEDFKIIPPVSFLDMIALEKNAELILTDSGGLQKEAFFFKKPCVVLRDQTEWVELVENGTSALAGGSQSTRILDAVTGLRGLSDYPAPPIFGDGKAADFICKQLLEHLKF